MAQLAQSLACSGCLWHNSDTPTIYTCSHLCSLPHVATCSNPSFLTKIFQTQLPKLLSITFVLTNNGQKTFFWLDSWLQDTPLATTFPSLYSHSTNTHIPVVHIMRYGVQANLVNRLTLAASHELAALSLLLQDFQLADAPDERFLIHGTGFSSRKAYRMLLHEEVEDDHAPLIWRSRAPHKLKIFTWLLFRGRLNTKCNLFHKKISTDAACP